MQIRGSFYSYGTVGNKVLRCREKLEKSAGSAFRGRKKALKRQYLRFSCRVRKGPDVNIVGSPKARGTLREVNFRDGEGGVYCTT